MIQVVAHRLSQAAAADRRHDPEFRRLLDQSATEIRRELEWRCGAALSVCISADTPYLDDADADLIYVSFEGEEGLTHGEEVLLSDEWLSLGAPVWKRVLAVDDDVWYESSGLAAAWLVLNDVKGSLDGNS